MSLPTELVGSLPRPMKLQEAYEAHDQGELTWEDLQAEQDVACRGLDQAPRADGGDRSSPTASSGRRASPPTRSPTRSRAPGSPTTSPADGQYFAIFDDGHHRQLPRLTGGPFRYQTFAARIRREGPLKMATKPLKQAVIAPSMLTLLYPLDEEIEGYSREQFLADLCDEVREGHPAGASTPARCGSRSTSPRAAWPARTTHATRGRGATCSATSSSSTTGSSTASRRRSAVNIGIHTCPGGDMRLNPQQGRRLRRSCSTSMFKMNAGYFLIQLRQRGGQGEGLPAHAARTAARTRTASRRCASSA